MPATLTASISSLILTLDDPGRDDLDSVIVWASTTSGFTPSAANLVYQGKSLKIVISNLTPSITYYVKYAYLSQIDTSDYVVSAQLSGVPVKVTESLIDDGAISLAKFAAGIEPIEIVSSLPSVGNFQGRTVFLTTDNKLYRYNGTAFVSTVPAGDLTGQITTTQITDDAITTAKIAANAITATELAASSVIAGKIAAGAISTTELAAGAVTAAKIAAGTITATEIAASTITGAKLAADTITAANIAANAITSSELAAGSVIAGKIAANAVTATEISAGAVTAGKIAANAVTATEISANAITSSKIETNALRGKTLAGGVLIDGGSVVTSAVSKPTDVLTSTTIALEDTTDFPTAGAAYIVAKNGIKSGGSTFRYTGKTSTSLTGVSGLRTDIAVGSVIAPKPLPSIDLISYAGTTSIGSGLNYDFSFRQAGGSAIAISTNAVADAFTYTAGQVYNAGLGTYLSQITGVTGLANFSYAAGSSRIIIDNINIPTTIVASTGTKTTLTINASSEYFQELGGRLMLASLTISGIQYIDYSSYSGTTITLATPTTVAAATYYVIPIVSFNVYGAQQFPLVAVSNAYDGLWKKSFFTTDKSNGTSEIESLVISAQSGRCLSLYPSSKTSAFDQAPLFIEAPERRLHASLQSIPITDIDTAAMSSAGEYFCIGSAYVSQAAKDVFVAFNSDTSTVDQYQPISNTLRFNGFDVAAADAITFDDATDTYSFGSDGTANNATLNAKNSILTLGASYLIQNANAKTVADAAVAQTQNQFIVWNASSTLPQISIGNQASSANGSNIDGYKARGGNTTIITAPVLDDNILALRGYLYDGAIWRIAASIKYQVDGAPSGADAPGRIVFATTDDGTTSHIDRLTIDSAGEIINTGGGRLGYGTGSGAAATQSTSRTTSVSINSAVGRITLFTAAGSTTWASFTVNNSKVGTNDIIVLNQRTGTNLYELHVTAVAAGSFQISFRTTGGTASDTPTISFAIIRGSNA